MIVYLVICTRVLSLLKKFANECIESYICSHASALCPKKIPVLKDSEKTPPKTDLKKNGDGNCLCPLQLSPVPKLRYSGQKSGVEVNKDSSHLVCFIVSINGVGSSAWNQSHAAAAVRGDDKSRADVKPSQELIADERASFDLRLIAHATAG